MMMMGGLGMILPLILIGVIIYAVFKLLPNSDNNNKRNDALDILNQKYANGDITEEEYIKKKKILRD